MEIFDLILWPIRWIIEFLLVVFHEVFTFFGMAANDGLTWVLSIVGLVVVVRASLIPVFVKQIQNSRKMLEIGPELKKIQDKYRGKTDSFSREASARATMDLYKKHGTNPYSSCLPMLVQMPIFFGLYSVLTAASQGRAGVGFLSQELTNSFNEAAIFGAPLRHSLWSALTENGPWQVIVIASIMVVMMISSQFITQLQIVSKNMSEETKASPTYKMQRMMLYIIPFAFIFSGVAFPMGVTFYWLISNIWTMVQQFLVIRNMPSPGTPAAKAKELRDAKKLAKKGITEAEVIEEVIEKPQQRVQPKRSTKAARQSGGASNPAQPTSSSQPQAPKQTPKGKRRK